MLNNRYYCSRKFTDVSLDLEKRAISSCCSAKIKKINFDNFTNLLNYEYIVQDRIDMLSEKRVSSCEDFCYNIEDKNLISYRQEHGYNKIFSQVHVDNLEVLDISIGSRCNLTCSYCSKRYSRSWLNDIAKNGGYGIDLKFDDRFVLTPENKAMYKLSQDQLYSSKNYQVLYNSLSEINGKVKNVQITGGEPFLYDQLIELVELLIDCETIRIYTGGGITLEKFKKKFDVLKKYKNVILVISAENLGSYYEFNRYGNKFSNFLEIVDYIKDSGIQYSFTSVISNITIFGFKDFVNFAQAPIMQNFCNIPSYLRLDVIDEESKIMLIDQLKKENNLCFDTIIKNLEAGTVPTDTERKNLSMFITEFAKRRQLDLSIYPSSFLRWLNVV